MILSEWDLKTLAVFWHILLLPTKVPCIRRSAHIPQRNRHNVISSKTFQCLQSNRLDIYVSRGVHRQGIKGDRRSEICSRTNRKGSWLDLSSLRNPFCPSCGTLFGCRRLFWCVFLRTAHVHSSTLSHIHLACQNGLNSCLLFLRRKRGIPHDCSNLFPFQLFFIWHFILLLLRLLLLLLNRSLACRSLLFSSPPLSFFSLFFLLGLPFLFLGFPLLFGSLSFLFGSLFLLLSFFSLPFSFFPLSLLLSLKFQPSLALSLFLRQSLCFRFFTSSFLLLLATFFFLLFLLLLFFFFCFLLRCLLLSSFLCFELLLLFLLLSLLGFFRLSFQILFFFLPYQVFLQL
mmetsp:Transcript_15443/g.51813  ORF Transcript_15443/g.51813 Transcript_15443/m.51813 type:complete len:344 (-) Transcript_15443:573-1604(-)